ncbi:transcription factor EB [Protopterus annectens]|uniref:transcription factor EB n=1 Tax=Protopterus annectens TaxID=7888 RepID=UPI001CFB6B76|nr:transcription factor EB [Protopterus annectens]XP_043932692.1 transcription factor EB [Protopterus annectens]XP_043932693.1 transcription factor EB [Protopterus annectens]XP_043932694.1 transcription factor EB [Protopterus annectens]XP_043932695.1 transcription factor EB [Protopterus annectens]XP_043932696.1 transcription factor EB [Protopterus annectens]
MASRTGLRLQLMREQLQQEEQRERQQQAAMQFVHQHMTMEHSPAVSAPVHFSNPPSVPIEVLKVQTYLENPTKYHLQESQRQQVKQYLSTTLASKCTIQALSMGHVPQCAASSPGVRVKHVVSATGNSAPNSPSTRLNHEGNAAREMDDVIDDIISLESSYNDDSLVYTGPTQQSPSTLPMTSNHLDVYSDPRLSCPPFGLTSRSCPTTLDVKQELTETEARALVKERQKKDSHNEIERRRRFHINDRIKELGTLIPKASDLDVRWNKGTILKASVDYIKRMQKEQQKAREVEMHFKRLEMMNKQLWLRIQELEMQAQIHGLSTASPTGINTAELARQFVKREDTMEEKLAVSSQLQNHLHHQQQIPASASSYPKLDFADTLELCDNAIYQNSLPNLTDISFNNASHKDLEYMLMDDSFSPLCADPLLSATSPGASKASSRRSSFSMEDSDIP